MSDEPSDVGARLEYLIHNQAAVTTVGVRMSFLIDVQRYLQNLNEEITELEEAMTAQDNEIMEILNAQATDNIAPHEFVDRLRKLVVWERPQIAPSEADD